ncbi:MAG: hypothetical protein SFY81_04660, partial [Verrucomicrobiota bacterium]|nr:hypothetical protein [Verrucomicrobiota bacterium]
MQLNGQSVSRFEARDQHPHYSGAAETGTKKEWFGSHHIRAAEPMTPAEFPQNITVSDSDKIKELEKALAETRLQLEKTHKDIQLFAYSVSNDLRSPVREIEGYSRS